MWVCLCGVWRLEVNLKCWPLPVSTLLFGAGSLPKPDDHWLARLADQWAQGIPLSTAMQHRMTGMCHYIRVFTRVLEIKHKSWLVYNNHFTNWAVSPLPAVFSLVSLLNSMMPCALPPDSLGSPSGKHPEETGKEKGADQMGRQVRGTYRPQSEEERLLIQAQFCSHLGRTLKASMVMP